jgi:hypothetical protein
VTATEAAPATAAQAPRDLTPVMDSIRTRTTAAVLAAKKTGAPQRVLEMNGNQVVIDATYAVEPDGTMTDNTTGQFVTIGQVNKVWLRAMAR